MFKYKERLQFVHQVVKILNVCDLIYIIIRLLFSGAEYTMAAMAMSGIWKVQEPVTPGHHNR